MTLKNLDGRLIMKLISAVVLSLSVFSVNVWGWTTDLALSGVDGQTVGANASISGVIDLDSSGYHLLIIHLKITPEASVTGYSYSIKTSVDGGSTISGDPLTAGFSVSGETDLIYKVIQYPYIKIEITNDTEESGSTDDLVVSCKFAVY